MVTEFTVDSVRKVALLARSKSPCMDARMGNSGSRQGWAKLSGGDLTDVSPHREQAIFPSGADPSGDDLIGAPEHKVADPGGQQPF
jgi:hypothetical protein